MTIADINEIEQKRDKEQFGVIHLLVENGFYRAHDWSAWLMTTFPFGEALNKPLRISAKRLKDGYIEAWVGFPVSSLGKYVPNDGSVTFNPVNDTQIDVSIELSDDLKDSTYEDIRQYVDSWKESLPMNDGKVRKRESHEIAVASLRKMSSHRVSKESVTTWGDVLDMDFLVWLTEIIVMLDPKENCIITGSPDGWYGLDPAKSMLHLEDGIGLPIGNLTSQLFSNVYLNVLDQFVKRELGCKYYGRYVDDACIVSHDKGLLISLVPVIRDFLKSELGLDLHTGKLVVSEVHRGVEFLGAYIKPYRTYMSRHSLARMEEKIADLDYSKPWKVIRSVNSYLGIMAHTASYKMRRRMFLKPEFLRIGLFDDDMTKITDRQVFYKLNNR